MAQVSRFILNGVVGEGCNSAEVTSESFYVLNATKTVSKRMVVN